MYYSNPRPTNVSGNHSPGRTTPNSEDCEKPPKTVQKLVQTAISHTDWYRVRMAPYEGSSGVGRPLWDLFPANPHYRDSQREIDANSQKTTKEDINYA